MVAGLRAFFIEIVLGLLIWAAVVLVGAYITVSSAGGTFESALKLCALISSWFALSGGLMGSIFATSSTRFNLIRHLGSVVVIAIVIFAGFTYGVS
ncbi:MAG: hypothetical protein AAGH41_02465 [Pseudomonadota bacterium]